MNFNKIMEKSFVVGGYGFIASFIVMIYLSITLVIHAHTESGDVPSPEVLDLLQIQFMPVVVFMGISATLVGIPILWCVIDTIVLNINPRRRVK